MYIYFAIIFLLFYFYVLVTMLIFCNNSQMGRRVYNNGNIWILSVLNSRCSITPVSGCKNELAGMVFYPICYRIFWSYVWWYTCFPPSCHLCVPGCEAGVLEFLPAGPPEDYKGMDWGGADTYVLTHLFFLL